MSRQAPARIQDQYCILCGLERPPSAKQPLIWGRCGDCQSIFHLSCAAGRKRASAHEKRIGYQEDPRCNPCKGAKFRLIRAPKVTRGSLSPDQGGLYHSRLCARSVSPGGSLLHSPSGAAFGARFILFFVASCRPAAPYGRTLW